MLVWCDRRNHASCTVSAYQQIPAVGSAPGFRSVVLATADRELCAKGMERAQIELSDRQA